MNCQQTPFKSVQDRRGFALLLVMGVLLIATTAAVTLVQHASTVSLQRENRQQGDLAVVMLKPTDAIIQEWLAREASSVVLAPDVEEPAVTVTRDRLVIDDVVIDLEITAWDQQGMPSIEQVRRGSSLRASAPQEVLAAVEKLSTDFATPLGLDQFIALDSDSRSYPAALNAGAHIYRSDKSIEIVLPRIEAMRMYQPVIGAGIATHGADPHAINVNTAPLALLESALRSAGRGGIEMIETSRREGRAVPLGSISPAANDEPGRGDGIRFVGSSTCWAFRIDIHINRLHRAWWCVYQPGRRGWERVQRLVITE